MPFFFSFSSPQPEPPRQDQRLIDLAHDILEENPRMALMLIASTLEDMATLPECHPSKLVEVNSFDEDGNPLFTLTAKGQHFFQVLRSR